MFPQTVRFTCTALAGSGKKGILPKDEYGYRIQPIGALNCFNSAGEFYTANKARELFEQSSSFIRRVASGCLKGEEGHPKREPGQSEEDFIRRVLRIDERNVCAHFAEIWLDFDNVKDNYGRPVIAIMGKVAPAGPHADSLERAFNNPNEEVCFSIRSFTDDAVVGGCRQRTLVEIVTFDRVTEPGIAHARKFRAPGLEGLGDHEWQADTVRRAVKPMPGMGMESDSISLSNLFKMLGMRDIRDKNPGFMDW